MKDKDLLFSLLAIGVYIVGGIAPFSGIGNIAVFVTLARIE